MKILSIDTASNVCGVSILDDKKSLCFLDTNTGRTHSENLMPMVQEAFKKTNLKLSDMDLLVCDFGPGSFTGIRIGVATVKAFVDSLNIPCSGISSLKALAYNLIDTSCESDVVCSIIDCKNDNCYFALYEKNNGIFETLIEPQADTIDSTLAIVRSYYEDSLCAPKITFVGDGSVTFKNKIQEHLSKIKKMNFASDDKNSLSSYSLGLAGLDDYNLGLCDKEILPLYLKKPQAQRQLEEKLKKM